jgi:hypothetical protein
MMLGTTSTINDAGELIPTGDFCRDPEFWDMLAKVGIYREAIDAEGCGAVWAALKVD